MSEFHTFCKQCEALDSIQPEPTAHLTNDEQTGGVYRCCECGATYGVWLETGKLNLGVQPCP